jgi:hypothetical protein
MTREPAPLVAAHADKALSLEAAQQLVQMAEDAYQPGQSGPDLPLADRAALLRNALPAAPCPQKGDETGELDSSGKLPIGLREDLPLTVAGAQKIRQILNDPGHASHGGKEMPTADPSVLVKKTQ